MKQAASRGGLVERNPDAFFLSPNDMARPLQLPIFDEEGEPVRDEEWACDVERRSGLRKIANGAVHSAAAELNRPVLQDAVARSSRTFNHGIEIRRIPKQSIKRSKRDYS